MNLGLIGNVTKKIIQLSVKNSPAILTGVAVCGVVATAASTAKAVVESRDYITAHDMDEELKVERFEHNGTDYDHYVYYRQRTFVEKAKLTWRIWVAPVFIGGTTIACILGANHISTKRNVALAAAYSMSEEAAREFRDKVANTIGEKKVNKIDNEIMQDHISASPTIEDNVTYTNLGEQLMYDDFSGRYFRAGQLEVEKRMLMLDKKMARTWSDGKVNDLYELIGLSPIDIGEDYGWPFDNTTDEPNVIVRFYPTWNSNHEPCIGMKMDTVLLKIGG